MTNYFEILDLEIEFAVDESKLQAAYVKAQQQYHPDRQVGKSDTDRKKAALASAAANDAHRILNNDYSRACHLLELQGIKVHGDDANTKPDASLLAEVMQWNEDAEEVKGSDAAVLLGKLQIEHEDLLASLTSELTAQNVLRLGYLEKTLASLGHKVKAMAS